MNKYRFFPKKKLNQETNENKELLPHRLVRIYNMFD